MQGQHIGFDNRANGGDAEAISPSRRLVCDGETSVIDFASWVVALLAARRSADDMVLRPDLLETLVDAAMSDHQAAMSDVMAELVRRKVSLASVSDVYIPAAAARLGDDWMDDRISFSDVSLATSRLQSLLRAISAAWSDDIAGADRAAPCLLLCVMPGEQHTLGAMVLMGQLRRSGVSVRLSLGLDREGLAAFFDTMRFDGVLVSASEGTSIAKLAGFVQMLRALGHFGLPVVIGGGVVRRGGDLSAAGADAVAGDIGQALMACGLRNWKDGRARLRA
ncbi:MAG: B12-binding domain-containing protein [Roseinatronobacter sp.]